MLEGRGEGWDKKMRVDGELPNIMSLEADTACLNQSSLFNNNNESG